MSIDTAVTYTITAPSGVDGYGEVAVLNDSTSGNFVGYLLDSSGFDSPEIRESFDTRVEGDGVTHGNFYYGQRPFTLEVMMALGSTWAASHARLDKLMRATNAMRSDGTVVWTETGGVAKRLSFRRQQPLRFTQEGRKCLFAAVSADPRIYAVEQNTTTLTSVTNAGNAVTYPRFTLTAPSNPTFTNTTTGDVFSMTISGGGTLTVDFANHTAMQGTVSRYSSVNFSTSEWWGLAPGLNNITVSGGGTNTIFWSSAWI